jgi:putative transposase
MALDLPQWGGQREGAGRPRTRPHPGLAGPGVPHLARPQFAARHPVHVTQRVQPGVGYLRSHARAHAIQAALRDARGMRVVHYSIQGNHLHLIVEADGASGLSRAMQRFATRLAMRLNRLAGRRGGVFADRYHARALRTPREVANTIRYLLGNYRHHTFDHLPRTWRDSLSTHPDAPLAPPSVWLLRVGWRREKAQAR